MSQLILILGMHRSGTSCVTQILQQAGAFLGHEPLLGVMPSNLDGHWESPQAIAINTAILDHSGGTWDRVPARIVAPPGIEHRIGAFLTLLRQHPISAFKDPRTVLTYPVWQPFLGTHQIVACVRHPMQVARSLQARSGGDLESYLDLWCDYNERLLTHLDGHTQVAWIDFHAPVERFLAAIRRMCRLLGLDCTEQTIAPFNPFLRHHQADEAISHDRARRIAAQLRERMAQGDLTTTEPLPNDTLDVPELIRHLSRIVARQNEMLQRLDRELQTALLRLNDLAPKVQDHHVFLARLRRSLPVRLFKRLV